MITLSLFILLIVLCIRGIIDFGLLCFLCIIVFCCTMLFTQINAYRLAKKFEKQGDYKMACYHYAIAILEGPFANNYCAGRIRSIWKTRGPFSYKDMLEKSKTEGDSPKKSGEVYYLQVVATISRSVFSKPVKRGGSLNADVDKLEGKSKRPKRQLKL